MISGLAVWLIAALWHWLRTKHFKYHQFPFSRQNYYILTSNFLIALAIASSIHHSTWLIAIFFIFGIAGIIGESGFSFWWKAFFDKRIWVYESDTVFNSFTSILNFFPWAIAGFFYVVLSQRFGLQGEFAKIIMNQTLNLSVFFFGSLLISLLIAFAIRERRKISFQVREFNWWTYLLFCLPIVTLVVYLTAIDKRFMILSIAFGLGAFIAEFLLGKFIEFFISKKLWYYSYAALGKKYSSPVNIIPFIFAGYYFLLVYVLFLKFI